MTPLQGFETVLLIGIGATAVLDLWLALLARLGVRTLRLALIGRWVGHLFRGRFRHAAIGEAAPVRGEAAIGVLVHYAVGVAFAAGLLVVVGAAWLRQPTLAPALMVGVATVLFPLLVMQPAMGFGIAASKTPTPVRNVLRSLGNHALFGVGLYLGARVVAALPG